MESQHTRSCVDAVCAARCGSAAVGVKGARKPAADQLCIVFQRAYVPLCWPALSLW
jgi:hypothetical protein